MSGWREAVLRLLKRKPVAYIVGTLLVPFYVVYLYVWFTRCEILNWHSYEQYERIRESEYGYAKFLDSWDQCKHCRASRPGSWHREYIRPEQTEQQEQSEQSGQQEQD